MMINQQKNLTRSPKSSISSPPRRLTLARYVYLRFLDFEFFWRILLEMTSSEEDEKTNLSEEDDNVSSSDAVPKRPLKRTSDVMKNARKDMAHAHTRRLSQDTIKQRMIRQLRENFDSGTGIGLFEETDESDSPSTSNEQNPPDYFNQLAEEAGDGVTFDAIQDFANELGDCIREIRNPEVSRFMDDRIQEKLKEEITLTERNSLIREFIIGFIARTSMPRRVTGVLLKLLRVILDLNKSDCDQIPTLNEMEMERDATLILSAVLGC